MQPAIQSAQPDVVLGSESGTFFLLHSRASDQALGHRGLNCAENSGFRDTCKTGTKNTKTRQQDKQQHKTNKDKSRQVLREVRKGETSEAAHRTHM